jgi:4-amino-4-deoxy-L-arabinose transferase-like glycosyltransferase
MTSETKYRVGFWPLFAAMTVMVIITAAIFWARAHPFGVHWDEALYLDEAGTDVQRLWAGKLLTLGGRILLKTFGRPPAYRILVLPFLAIFGFHVMVARLVSIGCFALSSWFVYLAARQVAGRTAGAFAALIFVLSPEVVAASITFGTDSSLYLATSAMLYYTFASWDEGASRQKNWIGLGIAIGLGLLAKTSFIAIAIPFLAFWLVAGHYGWFEIPSLATQRKAGLLASLIALPWWLLNIRKSFDYAKYARGFSRNSLGSPSIETWLRWLSSVVQALLGYGLAALIILVLIAYALKAKSDKNSFLTVRQRAAVIACCCAGAPIVLAQLSGTNHLLRHISPAMIPLGVVVGVFAEKSGWSRLWFGAAASVGLFCGQLLLMTMPVAFPNTHAVELELPNGFVPSQAMARFDQWDWTPLRTISESCGLDAPKISYLGNGRAFDPPQIQFSWISKGLQQPDVVWLWRFEDGPADWAKIMDAADQSDIVITAPGYVGESEIKENLDNQHNAEFADRISRDAHFQGPTRLAMGRFEPVPVLVFSRRELVCREGAVASARR